MSIAHRASPAKRVAVLSAFLAATFFATDGGAARAAGSGAKPGAGLAQVVPADTIALFSLPDLPATTQDLRSLPIGKIAAEPSVREFLSGPLQMLSETMRAQAARAEQASGMPWVKLYESLGKVRSLEVALTRLAVPETSESVARMLVGEFGLALRVDAGEAWPAVRAVLEKGLEMGEDLAVVRESGSAGDAFVRVTHEEPPITASLFWKEEGTEIYFALASTPTGLVDDLWKRVVRDGDAPSLATDPEYLACARRCGADEGAEVRGFVRFQPLFDYCLSALGIAAREAEDLPPFLHPGPVNGILQVLGLRGMRAIAFASTASGEHSVNEVYVHAPAPRRGLLGMGDGAPVDRALLRHVPADATAFSVGRVGLANLWDTLEEALPSLGGDVEAKVREALDLFEAENGVEVREDLLASLGDAYVAYSLPTKGIMTVPEQAILVRLVDAERFERAANAFADALAGMTDVLKLKEREYEGTNIRSFSITRIPGGKDIGGQPNPLSGMTPFLSLLSPSYAVVKQKDDSGKVVGGTLLVSMNSTSLRRSIRRLGGEPAGGAESIEGYQRFAAQVPEKVSALSYSDDRSEIGVVYAMVTSFVPMVAASVGPNLPFDLNALPPADAITRHLFGEVSYTVADGEGIYSRSFSPWGVDTMALLTGGIAGGAAALLAARFEEVSRPVTYPVSPHKTEDPTQIARRDLRDLKAGIGVYRLEHGSYPPSLEVLLEKTPEYPDGLLLDRAEVPADPWGNAYVYEVLEKGAAYRLRSVGKNGKDESGEGDDVVER